MKEMISLTITAVLCTALASAVACGAVTVVEREAFWLTPPKADPQTVALWTFDDDGGSGATAPVDDNLGDLLAAAAMDGGAMVSAIAGRPGGMVKFDTVGGVDFGADGFFGKGAAIGGDGFLRSRTVNFAEYAQASLELQLFPHEKQAAEAVVLDFPAARVPCRLLRGADGTISLEGHGGVRLTHHLRQAPDSTWTHLALSFPRGGGLVLLVNGVESAPEESVKGAFPATPAQLGNVFAIGAAKDGFNGVVDTVRVLARPASLYVLEEMPQAGEALPAVPPALAPWFAYSRGPLLSLDFDGAAAKSVGVAMEREPAAFMAGVRGQAATLAAGEAVFSGEAILPADRGTLSLWFRPLDWNNLTQYCQYGNDGPVPTLRLLSFIPEGAPDGYALRTVTLGKGIQQPQHGLPQPWTPFHPGRWVHLVCVWDGQEVTIYLDGKKQTLGQVGWNAAGRDAKTRKDIEKTWRDGGAPQMRLVCHSSGTAIDALAVYPWAFTEQEVANDYGRFFPDSTERLVKLEPVTMTPQYDHYRQQLAVRVHALPQADREPDRIRLTVSTETAIIPGAVVEAALPHNGRTNVVIAVPLDFDTPYVVRAETFIAGKAVATVDDTFTRVKPEWWRNTLGKGLDVPAPWSPVAVAADGAMGVWGRTLQLAAGGLPTAITSAGAELLEGPLRLHGKLADGTAIELSGTAAPEIIEAASDRVRWSGKLTGGGVAADIEGELEYDGLIRLRLTLRQAGAAVALQRLDLDVPLSAAHATQVLANGGGSNFRASWDARLVPAGDGCVWNSREAIKHKAVTIGHFLPVIWLGDDWRGLCFFGENDRGWTPDPETAAQEIWREGEAVVYRMRLISQPLTLDAAREIEFFIHPTPTKPLPERWRAFNRDAPPLPNYEGIDAFISPTLTVPAGLPSHVGITFEIEPHSWEDVATNSEVLRRRAGGPGSPRLFYIDYSWPRLGPSMAEFTRAGLFARGRLTWTVEVEDYMVWIINEYIRRDFIDGIYIDDTSLGSTIMTNSTAYRLKNGTTQPGFNTMGFRRFLQRVWSLYAAQGKQARIMPHMTYCYEIPALSFADAVVNGEDRDIYPYDKRTFPERWPYEQLRVLAGSEKFGFVHFWKAGVNGEKASTPRGLPQWLFWQNRAMKGWLLLQDTEVMWGAKVGAKELLAFGAQESDTRFIRAEETTAWFRNIPATLHVAAYLRDRRALLVVFNHSGEEISLTLDPDLGGFFKACTSFSWHDAESDITAPDGGQMSATELDKAAKLKDRSLSLNVPTLDATALDDLLDPRTPQEKERERLAVRVDSGRATFPVRSKDFRLLLLNWQGGGER